MRLTVNASKTFNEFRHEHDVYSGVAGYTFDTASNKWINTGINLATKTLIQDWFDTRIVCNDEHFLIFFKRVMNNCALRYAQMERIELSAFDPLVANYMERQTIGESNRVMSGNRFGSTSVSESGSVINSGSRDSVRRPDLIVDENGTRTPNITETHADTRSPNLREEHNDTRTPNLTEQSNGQNSQSTNNTQSGTDTTTRNSTGERITKQADKQAPQSISYNGGGGSGAGGYNRLPALDWQYMTAQRQNDDANTESGTESLQHGLKENGTQSGSNSETKRTSGNETTNGTRETTGSEVSNGSRMTTGRETTQDLQRTTGTDTTTTTDNNTKNNQSQKSGTSNETNSGTESGLNEQHEIMTGRGSLTPQEAFAGAVAYLKNSSSWDWLRKELEPCFLAVYDV